jgi:hypothetical protein
MFWALSPRTYGRVGGRILDNKIAIKTVLIIISPYYRQEKMT